MRDECWYKYACNNNDCDNCIRYIEMSYLMRHSNIPEKRQYPKPLECQACDSDSFRLLQDIKQDIYNFVTHGENLCIFSTMTGNGKTSWAIKLMLKYFDCVWAGNGCVVKGLFLHVPTFLNALKENISHKDNDFEEMKQLIPKVDLIVWDDIASVNLSNYDYSQLLTYIDQRTLAMKSNIYTGNLTESDVNKALGNILASRICNTSTIITLKGKDRRTGNYAG